MEESTARLRRVQHLRVPVFPDEKRQIEVQAAATGKTVAAYLREVGMGYQPRGTLDHARVSELAKINGDMGRLGGLLKLWLTDDERTAQFGEPVIRALLRKIEATQETMHGLMERVVRPRSGDD